MFRSLILLSLALVCAPAAFAATFTVTTAADSGPGSLRQAILDANALPGLDTIHFNIAPGGPQVISLASALPLVTDTVNIDGTTQPGFAGTPIITIDQNMTLGDGLFLDTPARSTIRGLVIIDGQVNGIVVAGAGATIVGNYIGVDASGLVADGNATGIVLYEESDGNVIGGTAAADRNVISGNSGDGIRISGTVGVGSSDNNVIQGNIIGLDAAASNALPNGFNGIAVNGADNNQIGGITAGSGNVLSGNASWGIRISSLTLTELALANVVQGNLIGTNGAGNAARPNGIDGIALFGANGTTVGGAAAGARNTISGNGANGIQITFNGIADSARNNVVEGNFIGTDAGGTADLGNAQNGIHLLGRENTVLSNVISGNGANGISIASDILPVTGHVVRRNRIGTDVSGTIALPNDGDGIASTAGTGNAFSENSIDANGGLGIDLQNDGVTANDTGDPDTGANNRQNFPTLTAAAVGATTSVTGTLNSTPARTFRVEFFSSPAADPSGFGEGRTFLGFANVTTDSGGNAAIAASVPAVAAGSVVTATATDLTTNDTSEFSNAVVAIVAPSPNLSIGDTTIVEPDSGTENVTFTVTLTSPAASDVTFQYATANGTATAPGDYIATAGTGVIPAGSLSTTIVVPVVGDQLVEPDETFVVNITGVTGAVATDTQGQATIVNDDAAGIPTLSEWALLLMALLLAAGGAVVMRR